MPKVNKGILIRIKPNATQRALLARHFGANRWLWNFFLNKRCMEYQETGKGSTYIKDAAALTKLKHDGVHDWLNEASTASMQRTLKHLDDSYKRFFRGNANFPNFKSKKSDQAFTLAGNISVRDNRVCIPKFQEGIKFSRKLPIFTKINNATIRRTASGKYYAALSVESDVESLPPSTKKVGIDLGLVDFAVLSNGKRIKSPKYYRRQQSALKSAQRHLARKKKGSKRKELQRIKVARIHEKIANSRKDFLHKASASVVANFGFIGVESLAVKNLVKNHSLAKSISDSGWGEFLRLLEYKSAWYGRELVKVGRFFPSSKCCSDCGVIRSGLNLSERRWKCEGCGAEHDRDLNASVNILREAIKWERESPITSVEAA